MASQNVWTIERFFTEKPIELKLFLQIKDFINTLGPIQIKTTKTQISFAVKRQFAWVWLPMEWDKKRPKNSIILSFSLGKAINNPQIVQVVEPYPGRWMHHIVIEYSTDLNTLVKEWLKEAYVFAS